MQKFKVALNTTPWYFFKLCKNLYLYMLNIIQEYKKMVVTELVIMSYKHLKLKLRVFLTGYTVAMVTCFVKKIIITCSPMIGHSSTDIAW